MSRSACVGFGITRAPAVQLHRADLRQVQQAFGRIADHEVRILVRVRNLHDAQARARLLEEMFLEERLRAVRVAQDGQRPVLVVRHGVLRRPRRSIRRARSLVMPSCGIQHAVGMREARPSRPASRRSCARAASPRRLRRASSPALPAWHFFTTSSVCAGSSRTTVFGSRSWRRPR